MDDQPELLLWGVPELHAGGAVAFSSERRFQLLVLLGVQAGRWVERDRIAALLWPEHALVEARRNLRKVLFKAHEVVGTGRIDASPSALRWSVRTDWQAFEDDLRAGCGAAACARRRGAPLEGIDDVDNPALAHWLAAQRARVDLAWHGAALGHLRSLPDPNERIEAARALLAVDPLDEAAMALLLEAERAMGRAVDASVDYRRYATRLAEELGVEPSHALRSLLDARPTAVPAAAVAIAKSVDVGFIGRRQELTELGALLARPECRCITILGPGGIGKSSLARRALQGSASRLPGGSHWVELQDLVDNAQFIARLARTLAVETNDTQDPVTAITLRIAGAPTLLVLDNAEHLAELPMLLDRLLAAAPSLRVLLTSRARMHGAFEWVLPLAGLAVPDDDSRDADSAIHFDAVRLFEARARVAQRQFRLELHLQPVIDVVEAVAGMPLAIELAASWVRLLPPAEIARELRVSMDLLQRDPASRAQPMRPEHESMLAVLGRAWQLLAPRERQGLQALSVFSGGFTRAAAQRVAAAPLPLLSTLVDKSLLAVDEAGRFSMHPLVAAYAASHLQVDAAACEGIRTAHAEFFAQHLGALAAHAYGDQRLLVAGVASEAANCRTAWQRVLDLQRMDLVHAMAATLCSDFEIRGRYLDGIALMSPALTLPQQHPAASRALTALRYGLSMLHHRRGDQQQALALAQSGVASGADCGDTAAYVGCLLNSGMCLWTLGRLEEARGFHERGLQVARERGDPHATVWALGNLGVCLFSLGHVDEAWSMAEEALGGSRELGDLYYTAICLNNLGRMAQQRAEWATATRCYEDAIGHCRRHGLDSIGVYLQLNLGKLLQQRGHAERATVQAEAALEQARRSGLQLVEWGARMVLATIAIDSGQCDDAWQQLRSVVVSARRQASHVHLTQAVATFGGLMAVRGESARAASAWRAARAQGVLDIQHLSAIAAKLDALVAATGAAAREPDLGFDELLTLIERGPGAESGGHALSLP